MPEDDLFEDWLLKEQPETTAYARNTDPQTSHDAAEEV